MPMREGIIATGQLREARRISLTSMAKECPGSRPQAIKQPLVIPGDFQLAMERTIASLQERLIGRGGPARTPEPVLPPSSTKQRHAEGHGAGQDTTNQDIRRGHRTRTHDPSGASSCNELAGERDGESMMNEEENFASL